MLVVKIQIRALEFTFGKLERPPLLTPQEELDLAARIKKGDREARLLMIKANLCLVVKIALDYANFSLPILIIFRGSDWFRIADLLGHCEGLFYQIGGDRESVGGSNRLLQFTCIMPIGGVV